MQIRRSKSPGRDDQFTLPRNGVRSSATRLAFHRRSAIRHKPVQRYLCLFWPAKVMSFKHLAIILDHLLDIDRVVFAVVRTVVIDAADVFILPGQLAQPGAPVHGFPRDGAHPYLAIADVAGNFRAVGFPPVNFPGRSGEITATIVCATLAALITVFHLFSGHIGRIRCDSRTAFM